MQFTIEEQSYAVHACKLLQTKIGKQIPKQPLGFRKEMLEKEHVLLGQAIHKIKALTIGEPLRATTGDQK